MTQRSARRKPSSGFRHFYTIIFAFLGAFFLTGMATAALARAFPRAGTTSLAGFSIAVLLGGSVGFVLDELSGARRSRAKETHPEEPWLWDEQWAAGRIAYSPLGGAIGLGVMAAFIDFFAFTVFVVALREFSFGILIFLLVLGGAALATSALTVTLVRQHFAFGKSELVLDTIPGVIGGELAGTVEVRMANADRTLEFQVSIACSGRSRQPDVWKKEIVVAADAWRRRGELVAVPFRFELPNNLPADRPYSVRVSADAKPVSYQANFSVPVFRTFESKTR
ncbi:MAG TPA: hypothetical protein VF103_18205 [Polyangiaceae bacterium]